MPALPLVPRQPVIAPLNADALQALAGLQQQHKTTKRLARHLTQAAQQLEIVAGQLTERATESKAGYQKKGRHTESNGEEGEEGNEEEEAAYQNFHSEVLDLTRKLDHSVRAVVDDQTWLDTVPDIRADEEEEEEEEDSAEAATAYPPAPSEAQTPLTLFKDLNAQHRTAWSSKTLTARYAKHNTYIGFYRSVHDARNPDDDGPPIPHPSLWFAQEEDITNPSYLPPGSQSQQQRRAGVASTDVATRRTQGSKDASDSDSDIEIAREKISLKCPITFLPFTDPLKSRRCPHAFDRAGIMDMLGRSKGFLPLTDEQNAELGRISDIRARSRRAVQMRTPAVACPVCEVMLAEEDLVFDAVLLRKVERWKKAEREEREEEVSDEEGAEEDSASAEEEVKDRRKSVLLAKREKEREGRESRGVSVVPATQLDGEEEREDDE